MHTGTDCTINTDMKSLRNIRGLINTPPPPPSDGQGGVAKPGVREEGVLHM